MHQHSHYRCPRRRRERKDLRKYLKRLIAENFYNMGKAISTKPRKHRVPGRINPRRNTPRHTIIKLTKIKDKDKILKTTREKRQIIYKGTSMRLSADFSTETLQARRE